VLKEKREKLLQEARGLDDLIRVGTKPWLSFLFEIPNQLYSLFHSLLGVRVSLGRKFDQVSISYML
jgi:hypothetical protein